MYKNLRPVFRSKFEELVYEDILHREISADYEPYKIEYTVPEKIRKYMLINQELNQKSGFLTPTMKIKRKKV